MAVFWYLDKHNVKQGTHNRIKRDRMAEKNYALTIGNCREDEFEGNLMSSDWDDYDMVEVEEQAQQSAKKWGWK